MDELLLVVFLLSPIHVLSTTSLHSTLTDDSHPLNHNGVEEVHNSRSKRNENGYISRLQIAAPESGRMFGHQEVQMGPLIHGSYFVRTNDERLHKVQYQIDEDFENAGNKYYARPLHTSPKEELYQGSWRPSYKDKDATDDEFHKRLDQISHLDVVNNERWDPNRKALREPNFDLEDSLDTYSTHLSGDTFGPLGNGNVNKKIEFFTTKPNTSKSSYHLRNSEVENGQDKVKDNRNQLNDTNIFKREVVNGFVEARFKSKPSYPSYREVDSTKNSTQWPFKGQRKREHDIPIRNIAGQSKGVSIDVQRFPSFHASRPNISYKPSTKKNINQSTSSSFLRRPQVQNIFTPITLRPIFTESIVHDFEDPSDFERFTNIYGFGEKLSHNAKRNIKQPKERFERKLDNTATEIFILEPENKKYGVTFNNSLDIFKYKNIIESNVKTNLSNITADNDRDISSSYSSKNIYTEENLRKNDVKESLEITIDKENEKNNNPLVNQTENHYYNYYIDTSYANTTKNEHLENLKDKTDIKSDFSNETFNESIINSKNIKIDKNENLLENVNKESEINQQLDRIDISKELSQITENAIKSTAENKEILQKEGSDKVLNLTVTKIHQETPVGIQDYENLKLNVQNFTEEIQEPHDLKTSSKQNVSISLVPYEYENDSYEDESDQAQNSPRPLRSSIHKSYVPHWLRTLVALN